MDMKMKQEETNKTKATGSEGQLRRVATSCSSQLPNDAEVNVPNKQDRRNILAVNTKQKMGCRRSIPDGYHNAFAELTR